MLSVFFETLFEVGQGGLIDQPIAILAEAIFQFGPAEWALGRKVGHLGSPFC